MKQECFLLFFLLVTFTSFAQQAYPIITNESTVVDTFYHDYIIQDKYRWLEDIKTPATSEWIKNQNKLSKQALNKSLLRTNALNKVDKYTFFDNNFPYKKGKYFFTTGVYSAINEPALYYRSRVNGDNSLLVDPTYISTKDKIRLKSYYVSGDSKYLAYEFSRNGSDWAEVKIVNLSNRNHCKDHLKGLKFSNIAWRNNGFYYCTYKQNNQFGATKEQQIFYHKLGTSQDEDELIFERNNPYLDFDFTTSINERFLIVKETNRSTGIRNVFYMDFHQSSPHFKPLVMNYKYDIDILNSREGKILACTSQDNQGGIMVEIDPANPQKWREILPEFKESVLLEVKLFKDKILAIYQTNQHPVLLLSGYDGHIMYKLDLPTATSISTISGEYNDNDIYFELNSYTTPHLAYKLNIYSYNREPVGLTHVSFMINDIEYHEVEYPSKDGTLVPMILVYKKGLELDGTHPTILKAYGGFGSVSTPSFNPGIVYFVKNGGVFAFANIRGGGDRGKQWAFDGRGDNKQTSFDDFIAGAEYLINEKYTKPDKLAITGVSNGGLVVAASAIQRPDLFKVVAPVVAPLDMLRLEHFTVGHFHTGEYGTVKDSASFVNLYNYSPYANIKEDVNYPIMLVVTADHDDRVPPFHSYKFVARLQNREAQKNPIYLKIEKNAGHYGASNLIGGIRNNAELFGFILDQLTR